MKLILSLALACLCYLGASATAQYPDKIIYNGTEYSLHSNPMEAYFEKHPDKRPSGGLESTALWRGYVATFEVRDGGLYLKDIQIEELSKDSSKKHQTEWRSVLKEVFPDNQSIKIDWFSGLLVIAHGKIVNYVHMGYGSTYEKYILLEINKGAFTKEARFDYKQYEAFKTKQFELFKKTKEYKKLRDELKTDGMSDEFIDSFIRNYIIEYTSKIPN